MPSPKPTPLEDAQAGGKKLGNGIFAHSAASLKLHASGSLDLPNYVKAGLAGDKDVGMFKSETLDLTYFWVRCPKEHEAIKNQKEKLAKYAEAYGMDKPSAAKKNWVWEKYHNSEGQAYFKSKKEEKDDK